LGEEEGRQEMTKSELTVLIPPDLLKRIQRHAEACGDTVSTWAVSWLKAGLAVESGAPAQAKRKARNKRRELAKKVDELAFVLKTVNALERLNIAERALKRH
jgi:hypothetical protein